MASGSPALWYRVERYTVPPETGSTIRNAVQGCVQAAQKGKYGPWTFVRGGDDFVELRDANGHFGIAFIGNEYVVFMGAGDDGESGLDRLDRVLHSFGFL